MSRNIIFNDLLDKYFEKAEKDLSKKVSIKNQRTKEGLEKVFGAALSDFLEKDFKNDSIYEKELDKLLKRNYFYYFNEPLIYKIVRKFDNLPLPENERYQAAATAFTFALNTFDEERGYQFSTYAWRVMSNEIIVANKKRIKHEIIKQKDSTVRVHENSTVLKIEEEMYGKKIVRQKEEKQLYNITVLLENGTEKIYPYIYDLLKKIKIGYKLKAGDVLGKTAGVETEYASVYLYTENEEHADVMFYNPTSDRSAHYYNPDETAIRSEIIFYLKDSLKLLTELERKIIIKRFLTNKKLSRKEVADEIGITEYKCSKSEKIAFDKIKDFLKEKGISSEMLDFHF